MFVRVSGLAHVGVAVPRSLRVPANRANTTCNRNSVTLALVRWLTPHPLETSRDAQLLPVCPPPFDINHALWTFAKTTRQRGYFTDNLFARQIDLFPGNDGRRRRQNALKLKYDRYDLIQLETMKTYMNCTRIDDDIDSILETISLPFDKKKIIC